MILKIKLSNIIGRAFRELFVDVRKHEHTYYNLIGGRGSLKSSFISIMIVVLILMFNNIHAVCYRKVASTLATSVYTQLV